MRDAGITQDVVAERCVIHRTYLSRIETGVANTSTTVASALGNTLNFEIRDLFMQIPVVKFTNPIFSRFGLVLTRRHSTQRPFG